MPLPTSRMLVRARARASPAAICRTRPFTRTDSVRASASTSTARPPVAPTTAATNRHARSYATYADTPPEVQIGKAPPPPPPAHTPARSENIAPSADDDGRAIQDSTGIWADLRDHVTHTLVDREGEGRVRSRVDQDEEGNLPSDYQHLHASDAVDPSASGPPLARSTSLPQALRAGGDAAVSEHNKVQRSRANQKLRAEQARSEHAVLRRLPRYTSRPSLLDDDNTASTGTGISDTSFDDFRMHHRLEAERPGYHPNTGPRAFEYDEKRHPSSQQPHALPLASRYDWRLRSGAISPRMKQLYGRKNIWRQRAPLEHRETLVSDDYKAYDETFRRFIQLERDEAEAAALTRMLKEAHAAATAANDGEWRTAVALPTTHEHLIGLRAVLLSAPDKAVASLDGTQSDSDKAGPRAKTGAKRTTVPLSDGARLDREEIKAHAEYARSTDYAEDAAQLQRELQETIDVGFRYPGYDNLPDSTFRKGKMVFIWECATDPVTGELYAPAIRPAPGKSITIDDLTAIAARGYVKRVYTNRIDVVCSSDFVPDPSKTYRLDVGYDATVFERMGSALTHLAMDAAGQRRTHLQREHPPHKNCRDVEILGTELHQTILSDFALHNTIRSDETRDARPVVAERHEEESELLMQDQRIASWAKRYSRENPMWVFWNLSSTSARYASPC